tara:strand:- start:221 stop:1126 length:906 start_codon:yes stop_codon:yes gene_type:complete
MKIKYVCPSYKRSKLLCQTTLPLLDSNGIDEISLYLSSDQVKVYRDEISKYNFNIKILYIGTDITGIGNIRNLIRDSYGEGTNVLMIDDDIKSLMFKPEHCDKLETLDNISEFVHKMFQRCIDNDVYMWGVQLHNNPYFMHSDFTTGLSYINGSFTGIRIEHTKRKIRSDINHFEDYLFSMLHFIRDKSILKAANVCLLTKCFNPEGGICQQAGGLAGRKVEAIKNGAKLELHFGELLYLKHSKKYDIVNIKLKKVKWRESFLDLWDNYEATKTIETAVDLQNLEKAVEDWDINNEISCQA